MTRPEWALLLSLSVLWGGSFFFAKIAVAEVPPFTLVFVRVAIAALALHWVARASGLSMPADRGAWRDFCALGLLNNVVPFALLFWGQTRIASGLASILAATTPVFGVLLAHFLTSEERMTGRRAVGVIVAFSGVVAMVGPDALHAVDAGVLAQLACVAAALSYALAATFARRFRERPPLVTAAGQVTCSALLVLPVALLVDRPWTLALPGASTAAAVLALALASTALAYVIYFRLLASAGATNALLVTFLIPVSALLLGSLLLGERLDPRQIAGMLMIGAGLAAIDGRVLAGWGQRAARR